MRVLGVDYGDARTGIAISDLTCSLVGTTLVIHSRNPEKTTEEIVKLVKENQVGEIVVGLPKNMDGTEGARAELCRRFAAGLEEASGLPLTAQCYKRPKVSDNPVLAPYFAWKGEIGCTRTIEPGEQLFGPQLEDEVKDFFEKLTPLYEYCNQYVV